MSFSNPTLEQLLAFLCEEMKESTRFTLPRDMESSFSHLMDIYPDLEPADIIRMFSVQTSYRCLACGRVCEDRTKEELPRSDEYCSHEWEFIAK